MAVDLSLGAKGLLALQFRKLIVNEHSVAKINRRLIEVLDWCDDLEFEPGKWIKPQKTYRFSREYIEQINQILLDENYASIFDDFSQDTHQSAAQRNSNEKQASIKPTHHLILAALTDNLVLSAINHSINQNIHSSQQFNIELDVNQLNLSTFDFLVVIENRDSFNDWFEFKGYTNFLNALVVYRGDKYHSTACKLLRKRWLNTQSNKPAIYFGDFDLAGLRIAFSAGYTHLLLPEYTWLTKQVIKPHYPEEQLKYLTRLERDCPKGWQSLVQLMSSKRAGLRQQKMYNVPLLLYPMLPSSN